MKKTAVAVAVAASALGMSQFAVADFVKDSKLSLDLRNYYFAQETDNAAEGGQWGQAFMLNYKSGFTEGAVGFRSEEHTSELQSRENLVCRLLLEKKKIIG